METQNFRPLEVTYSLKDEHGIKVKVCKNQESLDSVLSVLYDRGGDIQCRYLDISHYELISGQELNKITERPSKRSCK